jgi:hypothetical protein
MHSSCPERAILSLCRETLPLGNLKRQKTPFFTKKKLPYNFKRFEDVLNAQTARMFYFDTK